MPDLSVPRKTINSREKLADWLRYYADLNLGEFYRSRGAMGKNSAMPASDRVSKSSAPSRMATQPPSAAAVADSALPVGSVAGAASQAQPDTLEQIREHLGDCTRCGLHKLRNRIVFGAGNPRAALVFVGEGPGADEDMQGLPFVGRAGKLLTQMIEAMGLKRDDVYICNVVKCRPPGNRKPEDDEVETCSPYLFRQIDVIAPKAVVSLGSVASQTLLRTKDPISRIRGNWFEFRNTQLLPTYHPAYLLRNPEAKGEVWKDLQKVMVLLGLPVKPLTR